MHGATWDLKIGLAAELYLSPMYIVQSSHHIIAADTQQSCLLLWFRNTARKDFEHETSLGIG
jgi:hypothetical protein